MADIRNSKPLAVVVEDDAATRSLIGLGLGRAGYEVLTTSDSSKALEILEKKKTAVLVLDTYLPQINGLDLLRRMKAERLIHGTIVIMISAYGFQEVVQQAIGAGAHAFLMKPVDIDLLLERIDQLSCSPLNK